MMFWEYNLCMDILMLSGNSLNNKGWIEQVAEYLKPYCGEIRIQNYKHWETGEKMINIDYEFGELSKTVQGMDEYVIFAKSAGTILAAKGIAAGILKPTKNVFCGFPLGMARSSNLSIEKWLEKISVPTIFIHNSHDVVLSYHDLELFLEPLKFSYKTIETPGETHDYMDFELIKEQLLGA